MTWEYLGGGTENDCGVCCDWASCKAGTEGETTGGVSIDTSLRLTSSCSTREVTVTVVVEGVVLVTGWTIFSFSIFLSSQLRSII